MQNSTKDNIQPKGFFAKGLNTLGKIKDAVTGETRRKATKERDDLLRYLNLGDKINISDTERAAHEAKIKSLEAQMPMKKLDGITTLKAMADKSRDVFARANGLSNRIKAFGFAAVLSGMSFMGNPAFAATVQTGPSQINNSPNSENLFKNQNFRIPTIDSIDDAVRLSGTVNPGDIVRINGRNVMIVGDGSKDADIKGVNLVESYKFAREKFATPQVDTVTSPIIKTNAESTDNQKNPVANPAPQAVDSISLPKASSVQVPYLSTPIAPIPVQIREPVRVKPEKSRGIITPNTISPSPVNIDKYKLPKPIQSNPRTPVEPVSPSSIINPKPTEAKPPEVTPISPDVFNMPTNPVKDPFKIDADEKPMTPLDRIFKSNPNAVIKPPVVVSPVIPDTKVVVPSPATVDKKPAQSEQQKPVPPPISNPNPSVPFVKPPAPPRPDFVNPETIPSENAPQIDTKKEPLGPVRSGEIKLKEFMPPREMVDAQAVVSEANNNRRRSMQAPDRINRVLGGVRQNGQELFVEGSIQLNLGPSAPFRRPEIPTTAAQVTPTIVDKPTASLK
jgi:hypothetical protein